ncbi:MAG: helix-turn-helix transcriptional regulator, partial [Betaproteobacteria bacterium]|nr:helix-turn-helix transcriptional regulator [Betaproteobacteria bacterium]
MTAQTNTLVSALKASLKARNLTYRDLAQRLDLSEASVKRLFAEESFSLKRLDDICAILEMDFFELARLARGASTNTNEMSDKQETALAADPRLLGLFYLVFNDWSFAAILETYDLTAAECTQLLLQLDKLGLIELGANNHLRLKVPKSLRLKRDGPIHRIHGKSVVNDFLKADFGDMGGYFHFEFRELSPASVSHLQRKL